MNKHNDVRRHLMHRMLDENELYHSDEYLGREYDDGMYHFKYVKREMVNGKWRYYYNTNTYMTDSSGNTKLLSTRKNDLKLLNKVSDTTYDLKKKAGDLKKSVTSGTSSHEKAVKKGSEIVKNLFAKKKKKSNISVTHEVTLGSGKGVSRIKTENRPLSRKKKVTNNSTGVTVNKTSSTQNRPLSRKKRVTNNSKGVTVRR